MLIPFKACFSVNIISFVYNLLDNISTCVTFVLKIQVRGKITFPTGLKSVVSYLTSIIYIAQELVLIVPKFMMKLLITLFYITRTTLVLLHIWNNDMVLGSFRVSFTVW